MKKIKNTLCILLSVIMLLSMTVPVSAVDTEKILKSFTANETETNTETKTDTNAPFSIEISTDKGSYSATAKANITVKVTNTTNETIENVSVEALFDGLTPVGKGSQTKAETEKLNAGESISFGYSAMVNKSHKGLNFLQKIIMFFKYLFTRKVSFGNNGFDNGREHVEESTNIKFGNAETKNTVKVYYGESNKGSTSKEYEELIKGVDIDEVYESNDEDISIDEETGIRFINNVIIIDFDEDCTDKRKAEIVNSINGKVVGGIEGFNELHVRVEKSTLEELESIIDKLNENDDIDAEYDEVSEITFNSAPVDDPFRNGELDDFSNKVKWDWETGIENLNTSYNNWWAVASNLPGAWAYDDYFSKINIGIVDSGFDNNHKDLNLQVVSKENSPTNHGTHVAGLIGANHNNIGIAGVVKNKSLYCYDAESDKDYTESEIYKGFEKLVKDYKCKTINLSVGRPTYEINGKIYLDEKGKNLLTEDDIKAWGKKASKKIGKLLEKGYDFLVVMAAGNGTKNKKIGIDADKSGYFASITNENCWTSWKFRKDNKVSKEEIMNRVIIVASADKESSKATYEMARSSNGGGTIVDIVAPGAYNYSTVAGIEEKEDGLTIVADGQKYAKMGGTSMAAPIVTGVASLVWSVNPDFTGEQVRKIVIDTAKQGNTSVKDNPASPTTGDFYMVNAKLAVEEAIKETHDGYINWDIKDGELIISGVGKMSNYSISNRPPWYLQKDSITSITIKGNITSIGNYAFADLMNLLKVTLRDNVKTIGDYAFYNCTSIEDINLGNGLTEMGYFVFKNCEKLKNLTIPATLTYSDHRYLTSGSGDGALADSYIEKLTIVDGATKIPAKLCSGATHLKTVSIPKSVTSIENNAFEYCENLIDVTIPENVTIIGDFAFYNCKNIENITIPNSVKTIGDYAFYNCTSIEDINLGNGLTEIGYFVFKNCEKLKNLTIPATLTYSDHRYLTSGSGDGALADSYIEKLTIVDGATKIPAKLCSGATHLKTVSIPKSVTSIENNAFEYCKNLEKITINNPYCEIYDNDTTINATATIYGYTGSTAQAYAEKYHRTFIPLY